MARFTILYTALAALGMLNAAFAFNAPPGVLTWCGKAYEPTYVVMILFVRDLVLNCP
jgi:hypothetical protein